MKRPRILFLTTRFPYPPIGGDKLKAYNLLKISAKHYDVDLLAFNFKNLPDNESIKQIEKLGINAKVLKFNPLLGVLNCGLNFFTEKPFEISFYNLDSFKSVLDKLITENSYDAVVAFFMRAGEFVRNINCKKLLVAEDCRTVYQRRSYEQTNSILQKAIRYHEWLKLRKYEPRIMQDFDLVTFVSQEDINMIKQLHKSDNYRLLTNGTDIENYKPKENGADKTILFVGKMNVHSNEISAQILAREVFPIVKKSIPDAKLIIAGADMSNKVRNLENGGIDVLENVPDIYDIYSKATIFANIHKGGSGIQNKNIEAMASGCALVTTSTGNQGINGIDGVHLLLAESKDEFAMKIIELMTNPELRASISMQGINHIAQTHTWEIVEQQFMSIMRELLDE